MQILNLLNRISVGLVFLMCWRAQAGVIGLRDGITVQPESLTEDLYPCNAGVIGADAFTTYYDDLNYESGAPARSRGISILGSEGKVAELFSLERERWMTKINSLQYHLKSEKFGTSYFVDFCYLGPTHEVIETDPPTQPEPPNHEPCEKNRCTFELSVTGNASDMNYVEKSELGMSVMSVCDLRSAGLYQAARPKHLKAPEGEIEADTYFNSGVWKMSRAAVVIDRMLNTRFWEAPRFCRIRVLFSESARNRDRFWELPPGSEAGNEVVIGIDIRKIPVIGPL